MRFGFQAGLSPAKSFFGAQRSFFKNRERYRKPLRTGLPKSNNQLEFDWVPMEKVGFPRSSATRTEEIFARQFVSHHPHRRDQSMFVIVGYILVIGAIMGGYLGAGGHIGILIQPFEVLIIVGAAIGAFVVTNSPKVIKATLGALGAAMKGSKYNKEFYLETLTLLYRVFAKMRQNGLLSIEGDIENPEQSELFKTAPKVLADHHAVEFITDYLRLMASGSLDVHQIDNLMDIDIETHHEEGHLPIAALARLADGMPAFGIVAAVMGVVHTMESVGKPPAELGALIAAALVGTFLGILVSYGFIGPLTGNLEQKLGESTKYYQSIKAGLIASMNGYAPPTAVEFARKAMFSAERPNFADLETHLKNNK
jgi:chemotaxis protein MotA